MSDTAATAATAAAAGAAGPTGPTGPTGAPDVTEPEPVAQPALASGNLVSYTWEDTYADGAERTRYGIVVGVPEQAEGEAPTVTVAWLEGTASMPAELLDAVSGD